MIMREATITCMHVTRKTLTKSWKTAAASTASWISEHVSLQNLRQRHSCFQAFGVTSCKSMSRVWAKFLSRYSSPVPRRSIVLDAPCVQATYCMIIAEMTAPETLALLGTRLELVVRRLRSDRMMEEFDSRRGQLSPCDCFPHGRCM